MSSWLDGGDFLALDVSLRGGAAWTCLSAAVADCGIHPLRSRELDGVFPRLALDPAAAGRTGYDGLLVLDAVSASLPAISP